jgi:hypothetical protein
MDASILLKCAVNFFIVPRKALFLEIMRTMIVISCQTMDGVLQLVLLGFDAEIILDNHDIVRFQQFCMQSVI